MYVDSSTVKQGNKSYTRYLLRECYRENGKVKHRTIANLSSCSDAEVAAIKLALRHKEQLASLLSDKMTVTQKQGLSFGAVWLVYSIARELGIVEAMGTTREGKLALWQVIARVIDQGSRLSAVRLAGAHAACDILSVEKFDENDLYDNLDWLAERQATIEDRLFRKLHGDGKPGLFLYDVTSSYLEGTENELSAFGYNRDGKKGKLQIVIGLLCDNEGTPLSVEVFTGNTQDPKTVGPQIKKVAERFGAKDVTFVGDRGMIKSGQIEALHAEPYGFHYITAITKPQIENLLARNIIQMNLFDQALAEVTTDEGTRYILRRNPVRAEEMKASREDKLASARKMVDERNRYLEEHPKAKVAIALRAISERMERLKISDWAKASATDRVLSITVNADALGEAEKFDGCYVLKTDLPVESASKETIHDRYKDLTLVESAFCTSKTAELEVRPIHVRLATRTRGHVFVVMMAYRVVKELSRRWRQLDTTVQEGLDELSTLCAVEVSVNGSVRYNRIPEPRESIGKLLSAAGVRLPEIFPSTGVKVTTKKKLPSRRK